MRTCAASVPAETIRSVAASRGCPFRLSRTVLRTTHYLTICISVCAIIVAPRLGLPFARIRWSSARTRLYLCLRLSCRNVCCEQGNRQSDCQQKSPGPMPVRQFAPPHSSERSVTFNNDAAIEPRPTSLPFAPSRSRDANSGSSSLVSADPVWLSQWKLEKHLV
jgi:hypothetical protein